MNYRTVIAALGLLVGFIGVFMIPSLGWSLWFKDGQFWEWMAAIGIVMGCGLVMWLIGHKARGEDLLQREALMIVGLGWLFAAAAGAVPFMTTGQIPSFSSAFFETMSGFTTTGSTILPDIESVSPSVLFWRSMTHWLGGIGIIVLFVAILPFFSTASRKLFQTEIPGLKSEGLTPRIKQTAVAMLWIYVGLSAAECLLLWVHPKMNLFDALCHTFGTLATGGFSTKNASIAHYDSLYIEVVIIIFMFLAGVNFTLHYFFSRGRWGTYWRDPEFRAYSLTLLIATLFITLMVWLAAPVQSYTRHLRDASFTVVSIMTTTGFCTADFDTWPNMTRATLVLLMFIGGCGGSTGGGIKVIRFVVLFRHLFGQIVRYHSPRSIRPVKLGGRVIDESLQFSVLSFFFAMMVIAGVATVTLSTLEPDLDLVSAFTAVAATLNNIGPGLERMGAVENYGFLKPSSQWLLSLCMVMGRLEVFSILVLLTPAFWRKA